MKKFPLHFYKHTLSFKAMHIQCLNENKELINGAYASGFIMQEKDDFYLYTCWHVVTSYNMHNVEVGRTLPNRKYLQVNLQNCVTHQPEIQVVGGNQTTILELYDSNGIPKWIQDKHDKPNFSLNSIGLKVPDWHDAIKLLLPKTIVLSEVQSIKSDDIFRSIPSLGDKVYIVGYPYGYSIFGIEQPTPIVLTRFMAAIRLKGRSREMLLDGPGAPGMSGGPIFIEHENRLLLIGIYTGLIYPDFIIDSNEKTTALGTMTNFAFWFMDNE